MSFLQMYASLAPRLGHTSFSATSVGAAELRGGKINWGSLGSSISNVFKNTGRFLGSTASKFAKSQTFQDIKRGVQDSGLVRNVAGLAGDTLSSLVDIGRLKLENELYNLRRKALSSIPADQLAQILQNYQQTHDAVPVQQPVVVTEPAESPAVSTSVPVVPIAEVSEPASSKRPLIEEIVEEPELPVKKLKIRGTGLEWQQQLSNMLGDGVRYTSTKHCY